MKADPRKMENNDPRFLHLYIFSQHRLYISLPLEMFKSRSPFVKLEQGHCNLGSQRYTTCDMIIV